MEYKCTSEYALTLEACWEYADVFSISNDSSDFDNGDFRRPSSLTSGTKPVSDCRNVNVDGLKEGPESPYCLLAGQTFLGE